MGSAEIGFANVWGVADEDLFARVMREGDAAHAAGRPFLFQVLTTSNHRPYTYPEGRIDIPSGSGRPGAVKYADYAVGKLIEDARKKPWFNDTLFVFAADHTAGAAGKIETRSRPLSYAGNLLRAGIRRAGKNRSAGEPDRHCSVDPGSAQCQLSQPFPWRGPDQGSVWRAARVHFELSEDRHAAGRPDRHSGSQARSEVLCRGPAGRGSDVDPALLRDAVAYYQFASHWSERFKRVDPRLGDARPADISAVGSRFNSRGLPR